MARPAIELHDVAVRYRLPRTRVRTFKEWAIRRLTASLEYDELQALDHVSWLIDRGSTVGLIGLNGAGKSTLLRVVAGILPPSHGRVVVRGQVAPIIELGTGFDLELTGRENVFFNGALFGRSRAEMRRRFDGIVDFSGLEEFIDAPLRTYSTGMVARLAFAIATAVEPDVLLLDEVLAVGDETFKARCLERIESFRASGAAILFVSHELDGIARLCRETVWLDHGRIVASGPTPAILARYRAGARSALAALR